MNKKKIVGLDGDKILFKSIPENFHKEYLGLKNCTVRFTDDWSDDRWEAFLLAKKIKLINTVTDGYFVRKISDKTVYKNLAIISWCHDE